MQILDNPKTAFVVINHKNCQSQSYSTLREAELNLDGAEFELRVCHSDGSSEVLVPSTYYKS
jgi:hypothetical protein